MKMNLFRKVCLTVMGVGVIGSLMSVGTFATFTATTTNPGNTVATGTILINDTTSSASNALLVTGTAPQTILNSGDAEDTTQGNCTTVIASACNKVLVSSKVTAAGIEPGEFLQGKVTVANTGTLPAAVAMQIQNLTTAVPSCGTGALVACADPGNHLAITIEDTANSKCLFGTISTVQAPTGSGTQSSPFIAGSGLCDAINTASVLGTGASSGSGSVPTGEAFGVCLSGCVPTTANATTALGYYNYNAQATSINKTLIYIPGSATTNSFVNQANTGNLTSIAQWKSNTNNGTTESHTFTITIGFPDTGTATQSLTGNGSTDTVVYGNSNQYQNASVSFDLVFYAIQ